ncbi:hypothetical protein J4206_04850 [Candidatus Woesearchaeota archaeon]|nr:hypothetical protein [Candidatus Woesearchaeota archaeon]
MLIKNKKKGQAAMEFLMTYGWAILVVLGLVCSAHQIFSEGGMQIQINNGLGNDIAVKEVSFTSDTGAIGCKYTATSTGDTVPAGVSKTFKMAASGNCSKAKLNVYKGARIKGSLNIRYLDMQTQFEHNQPGSLLTDVEEGSLPAETAAASAAPEDTTGGTPPADTSGESAPSEEPVAP